MLAQALLPVVMSINEALTDISKLMTEVEGPVKLVEHVSKLASSPPALAEQLVKDAFHFARKADRKEDLAAVHFLVSAWDDKPHDYKQWHEIGHSLGIIVLAIAGN